MTGQCRSTRGTCYLALLWMLLVRLGCTGAQAWVSSSVCCEHSTLRPARQLRYLHKLGHLNRDSGTHSGRGELIPTSRPLTATQDHSIWMPPPPLMMMMEEKKFLLSKTLNILKQNKTNTLHVIQAGFNLPCLSPWCWDQRC